MTYDAMRLFADSWGLVYLVVVFIGVCLFVFRPGSAKTYQEKSEIPLREDEHHGR